LTALANAADAWVRDPRDVEVYRRLILAVEALRAHRAGRPFHHSPTEDGAEPGVTNTDVLEVLDGLADVAPPTMIREMVTGSATHVVERLRRSMSVSSGTPEVAACATSLTNIRKPRSV